MLLFLCIVFPLWFGYRRSVSPEVVEVNHVPLFTFGFLFYWILPIAVGQISSTFAGDNWSDLFGAANFTSKYLAVSITSYRAFAISDSIARRSVRTILGKARAFSSTGLAICLVPAIPAAIFTAYIYRSLLFQQYGRDIPAERARGTVSAFVIFFGVIALLHISDQIGQSFKRIATSWFVLPFVAGCIFMLVLASRIYVVSFILIFVVYSTCFIHRFKIKNLILGATILAAISGTIGALRVGLSIGDSGSNLILEPMLTSFSLIYFLRYESLAWIHFPTYLISDLVNLVPTALLPGKSDLIQFPFVYNPGGAVHSFVSFNYNFGIIGTVGFMFLLPIVLRWIRAQSSIQLFRVSYSMLSGFLAFTFFRDPFSVSLVREMLEFSVIMPAVLVAFNRLIQSTESGYISSCESLHTDICSTLINNAKS